MSSQSTVVNPSCYADLSPARATGLGGREGEDKTRRTACSRPSRDSDPLPILETNPERVNHVSLVTVPSAKDKQQRLLN